MAAKLANRRIRTSLLLVAGCSVLGALRTLVCLQNSAGASGGTAPTPPIGVVSTQHTVGSGFGLPQGSGFSFPEGVAVDQTGDVYVGLLLTRHRGGTSPVQRLGRHTNGNHRHLRCATGKRSRHRHNSRNRVTPLFGLGQ